MRSYLVVLGLDKQLPNRMQIRWVLAVQVLLSPHEFYPVQGHMQYTLLTLPFVYKVYKQYNINLQSNLIQLA